MDDAFCVSASILGSDRHMVVDREGFTTTKFVPKDVWFLNGVLDPTKPLCLDSLLKLGAREVDIFPPEKYVKALRSLTERPVPWSSILPSAVYKHFVKNLIKSTADAMDGLPKDYYKDVWCPAGQLLAGLKASRVDGALYREICSTQERDSGALASFQPGPGGFLPVVEYDRFATRTGRLTVSGGPNILTLKKKYRKLLRSSFSDGIVCSLDFAALEARIILAESGESHPHKDLYAALSNELFRGSIDREVIKTAVISELYGASKHALGPRLGLSGRKLDEFTETIHGRFKTADLRKRLKLEFIETGKIKNKYGRLLELDDPQDHLFVNTYAQSTGVDVALLGFKKIIDALGPDGIRPLFVLHDALILDVRNDRLSDVESVSSVAVPGYDAEFPLKFETVK